MWKQAHNSPVTASNDSLWNAEQGMFLIFIFKNDQLLQGGLKQMNEVRKSIQDLYTEVSNTNEKFNDPEENLSKEI